ncbi:MAG: transglutaminase domain-containing protein, partial [Lachnospiraceae bacterium]|nr:transglutaminase domain-containing protein [Lachnospiraceae bacterium]
LIFAASYGTVGALISSFDLPCYQTPLMLLMLVLSVLLAFLHYSRLLFNLFYPVIFVSFTYFIFTFRYMVNSGYQAFVNILQQSYGDYYALDTYRQSQEYFADRAMTITYAASFIGFFLILLLNIFISEYMSLVAVIALTFPLFQIGIYVERMPSMSSFVLILFSYFMVGILRSSRHFLLPYRDKRWTEFKYKESGGEVSYRYHASGRLFWQLTVLFFCFTLGIGILTLPMLGSSTNSRLSSSRRSLDEYMQVFTQNGLTGFFDRYSAKGGISGGQLGGVSSVRPDYQTDMNITFVPYSYDSLYLKAYTGSDYTGDSWQPAFVEKESPAVLTDQTLASLPKATMRVENLDAETGYLYLPYYVGTDIGMSYIPLADGYYPEGEGCPDEYDCTYHPTDKTVSELLESSRDDAVKLADPDGYLQIPEELSNYLKELHSEIGEGSDPVAQADKIYAYLEANYPYSQTPGITPEYEDFVKYFLETQKRGYCSHFASAGVMLMRSFGYPARYCEGYCVSLTDVSEGSELEDENYDDWYQGENTLGKTGVVTVPVTDGSAHAWAEIFVEGLGWIPYEFTPPSDDTDFEESYSGFWEIFSGL